MRVLREAAEYAWRQRGNFFLLHLRPEGVQITTDYRLHRIITWQMLEYIAEDVNPLIEYMEKMKKEFRRKTEAKLKEDE